MMQTPVFGTPHGSPRDEVCKLPDSDPLFVRLVYYTSDGRPTWERKVPIGADISDQQVSLLSEAREWDAQRRRRGLHVITRAVKP